jgi:hypothetical protein
MRNMRIFASVIRDLIRGSHVHLTRDHRPTLGWAGLGWC